MPISSQKVKMEAGGTLASSVKIFVNGTITFSDKGPKPNMQMNNLLRLCLERGLKQTLWQFFVLGEGELTKLHKLVNI